jgi:AcrR family transcriptional regulator
VPACPAMAMNRHKKRADRTREKLIRSFVELVLTRGYEHLSPGDVAAHAGIGRSTLYTHFAGLTRILEASLEGLCARLAASVLPGAASKDLVPLIHHFRDQSRQNAVFFREPVCSLWSRCLGRAIAARLRQDRDRYRHRPSIPRHMLPAVLADLQIALIRRWLVDPAGTSAEVLAATLTASAQQLVRGAALSSP